VGWVCALRGAASLPNQRGAAWARQSPFPLGVGVRAEPRTIGREARTHGGGARSAGRAAAPAPTRGALLSQERRSARDGRPIDADRRGSTWIYVGQHGLRGALPAFGAATWIDVDRRDPTRLLGPAAAPRRSTWIDMDQAHRRRARSSRSGGRREPTRADADRAPGARGQAARGGCEPSRAPASPRAGAGAAARARARSGQGGRPWLVARKPDRVGLRPVLESPQPRVTAALSARAGPLEVGSWCPVRNASGRNAARGRIDKAERFQPFAAPPASSGSYIGRPGRVHVSRAGRRRPGAKPA